MTDLNKFYEFRKNPPKVVYNAKNPHFGNQYATLEAFQDAIDPALAEHGLYIQLGTDTKDSVQYLTGYLVDSANCDILSETCWPLGPVDASQHQLMGAATYGKRALYSILTGVSAEKDDDGNAASGITGDSLWKELAKVKEGDLAEFLRVLWKQAKKQGADAIVRKHVEALATLLASQTNNKEGHNDA